MYKKNTKPAKNIISTENNIVNIVEKKISKDKNVTNKIKINTLKSNTNKNNKTNPKDKIKKIEEEKLDKFIKNLDKSNDSLIITIDKLAIIHNTNDNTLKKAISVLKDNEKYKDIVKALKVEQKIRKNAMPVLN